MKATLTFNLPDEEHEYSNAVDGSKMRHILWDVDQFLRAKMKYEELSDGAYDAFKETREHLRRLLIEEKIDLEK
jgi:hypothetical protein